MLGLAGSELADQIRNQPLVAPQSELEGLNSKRTLFASCAYKTNCCRGAS